MHTMQQLGTLRLGCPVWAFDGWRGSLYSRNAQRGDFLPQYARVFGAVEGFAWPSASGWLLLIAAGACAACGFLTQILAFKVLTATELAPLRYTALIWALLLGWVLWSEFPDLLSLIGGVLVVVAGLMVMRAPARR